MPGWILKARDREPNFLASTPSGLQLVSKAHEAMAFDSIQAANEYAKSADPSHLSTIWTARPPELVPVQTGVGSFIVELWVSVFMFLGRVSLFTLARFCLKKVKRLSSLSTSYSFVESWVLFWNLAAIAVLILLSRHFDLPDLWRFVFVAIGMLRVFEIVIYQINVVLLDEYINARNPKNPPYAVRGFRRLVLLSIHNYIEVLFWFASFYEVFWMSFDSKHIEITTIGGSLYFSIVTMATLGYGDITPAGDLLGIVLIGLQTGIGIFMVIIAVARVLSLIPKPLSLDEFEK